MSVFFERVRFRFDHRWSPRHMSDYIDGDLSAARHERLARHVEDCPECDEILATLQAMVGALHGLRRPDEPSVADAILDSVRAGLTPRGGPA